MEGIGRYNLFHICNLFQDSRTVLNKFGIYVAHARVNLIHQHYRSSANNVVLIESEREREGLSLWSIIC